jgi:hypothetical protein
MSNIIPDSLDEAKFGQIYFFDNSQQTNRRASLMEELSQNLIKSIQLSIATINPFIQIYKKASEYINNNPQQDLKIIINSDKSLDRRRYNSPVENEVAAIIIGNEDEPLNTNRQIVLYKKPNEPNNLLNQQNNLQIISDKHPSYDSLHYVLMFPFGDDGWAPYKYQLNNINHTNVQNDSEDEYQQDDNQDEQQLINSNYQVDNNNEPELNQNLEGAHMYNPNNNDTVQNIDNNKFVTVMQYYSYKLQDRTNSYIQLFGRLYQQYIVDQYVKLENSRLSFIRFNQNKLRTELYRGLYDLVNSDDHDPNSIGRAVILPSTFIGGPRYLLKLNFLNY